MRLSLSLIVFLGAIINGYAQVTATLSGRLFDQETRSSIALATVTLAPAADQPIRAGALSDMEGRFSMENIPSGSYVLFVNAPGYEAWQTEVLIGELNQVFDLGKVFLQVKSTTLGEVTIEGSTSTVSEGLEKKTFSLDDNISQSGGSVLDALRNLPGVTVDPQGKVLIRGSEQVLVLMDGRESSLTGFGNQKGLDQIPASNVDRIEIINNPSAKFESRGMAGVVNIIYKKEQQKGLNGEVGVGAGFGEWTTRRENLPNISRKYSFTPKVNPSLRLNYRSTKTNFFLQADGFSRRRINANEFSLRNYTDPNVPDITSQFLENRTQNLYNIKGGLDFYLNPRTTVTAFALWQDEYHIDRGDVPYDNAETGQRIRLWRWAEDEHTRFINYSASVNHKFPQAGHELTLGYLYTGGGEDEFFPFSDSSAIRQSKDNTFLTVFEYINTFNLDYTKPLKSGRLEMGTRIRLRNIPLTYTLFPGSGSILDRNLGAYSNYSEDVYAFYGNYLREARVMTVEAGMRFEPTFVDFTIDPANRYYGAVKYHYLPLFPNVRLSWKLPAGQKLSAFYSRRVDRPGEFDLRPFPKYDDPEILKTGNPSLRPQFTQSFEVAYKNSWDKGSIYVSTFYRKIDGIFSRVYGQDTASIYPVVNAITQNIGKGTNLGAEVAFEQAVNLKWRFNASFSLYRNWINAASGTLYYPYEQPFQFGETKILTWNAKFNNTLRLAGNVEWQVTAVYYAPDLVPQGKILHRFSLDTGLKKKIWNGKGEWILAATDLLHTFQVAKVLTTEGLTLTTTNYYETQAAMLTFRYKL